MEIDSLKAKLIRLKTDDDDEIKKMMKMNEFLPRRDDRARSPRDTRRKDKLHNHRE